ncbi:hypothetical protein VU04_06565 [Desulfobulbus sp. TB]|nr:hypothetical protein [Desulfobulbus sp. TB]
MGENGSVALQRHFFPLHPLIFREISTAKPGTRKIHVLSSAGSGMQLSQKISSGVIGGSSMFDKLSSIAFQSASNVSSPSFTTGSIINLSPSQRMSRRHVALSA